MRIPSLTALAGFIVLIAGTYCPMLRPLGIISMNVYDLNKPYGIVILLIGVIGITGVVFNQLKIARTAARVSLVLVVVLYIAAYFKVHFSFSFGLFNSAASFLAGKFKWGWYVIFTGAILSMAILFKPKRQNIL